MEEKLHLYCHGAKLDLLAQLAITKTGDRELAIPCERPPPLKTLGYHTNFSLGYQLWSVTNEFAKEGEKWNKENEGYTKELEKK